MPNNSDFRLSRRHVLSQGMHASLGFALLLKQRSTGSGGTLQPRSRLASATTPRQASNQASSSEAFNQVPVTVTIHFKAKPGQTEALATELTQAMEDARRAPGCRHAQVYVTSNKAQVVLFKGWDNLAAQAQYLQQEERSGRLANLLTLVEGDPTVEYWEFQSPVAISGQENASSEAPL